MKQILKKVYIFDIIIAIISFIISYVFFKTYDYLVVTGLFLAAFNFLINAITTTVILSSGGKKMQAIIASAVRIIITLCIVIVLCGNDKYKYIAMIIGYTLHYLAVTLYGLTIKK